MTPAPTPTPALRFKLAEGAVIRIDRTTNTIDNIPCGKPVSWVLQQLTIDRGFISVTTSRGAVWTDMSKRVETGMYLRLIDLGTHDLLTFIVRGDVDGDAYITIADLHKVKKHLLGQISLPPLNARAAMVTGGATVSEADLKRLKQHLLGDPIDP